MSTFNFLLIELCRYALRHNLTVMTFLEPRRSNVHQHIPMHKIDVLKKGKRPDHYDMIMEHIYYEKDELDKLMPGKKRIISSVRYPYDQFKSFVNFRENTGRHVQLSKAQLSKAMVSAGHEFISVPKELIGKRRQLKEYLDNLNEELKLVSIAEYYDASLVLMKRIFCWDLLDILYSKLKQGKYKTKKTLLNAEKEYKDTRPDEYAMYNYFNKTFWAKVSKSRPDFMDEVRHFQQIQDKVGDFCKPYQDELSTDPTTVLNERSKYVVAKSKWNKQFSVSVQDCIIMKMHKFAWNNIYTIKNFPSLCNKKKNLSKHNLALNDGSTFEYRKGLGFRFNSHFLQLFQLWWS